MLYVDEVKCGMPSDPLSSMRAKHMQMWEESDSQRPLGLGQPGYSDKCLNIHGLTC